MARLAGGSRPRAGGTGRCPYNGPVPDLKKLRVSGRLQVHRDGYGFLLTRQPIEGIQGDIFIPPDAMKGAMHGDHVQVQIKRVRRDGRAEGEVVRILQRGSTQIVGTFRLRRKRQWVVPADERIQQWIEIPKGLEIPPASPEPDRIGAGLPKIESAEDLDGMIVTAEILQFPSKQENPVGRVVEILGRPGDFGVDVEIIIRKHHIPHRFPPDVLEQAQSIPAVIRQEDLIGRREFRGLDVVTIDGETARDFDDAVWVDQLDNGHFLLHVHIADVSHYVKPGTPIDREAALRGNSVYFPDRAVPMLPLELSTGICSLNPGVDRLVMSVLLEIDRRGEIVSEEFTRGVIRSVERMTYTNVHLILEGDERLRERYHRLVERFEMMRELAMILYRKRQRRGAIDFDLPEPLIEFDEFGEMVSIQRSPRNIAHRIIEEFMLAANEAVARFLTEQEYPMIYRVHEPPDPEKVIEFEEIAAQFGLSLGIPGLAVRRLGYTRRMAGGRKTRVEVLVPERIRVTPRHYQKLIAKIEGKPEERIVSYLMLRSLKQARYSEENLGHFALATDCYTHFTSPIRRYPDLVVHRILGAHLDRRQPEFRPATLRKIAEHCSETERRADEAERELVEIKKLNFMADRVGEEFEGLIIHTTKHGFFVELGELFVEGFVPIDSLPGDLFYYEEGSRRIVGRRTRRQYRVGDRVKVRLDRVDAVGRQLWFSVVDERVARR